VAKETGLVPRRQEIAREAADEDQVDGAVADDLVCDCDIAAPRVADVGHLHAAKSPIATLQVATTATWKAALPE
jgi:hypothetical protein